MDPRGHYYSSTVHCLPTLRLGLIGQIMHWLLHAWLDAFIGINEVIPDIAMRSSSIQPRVVAFFLHINRMILNAWIKARQTIADEQLSHTC